MKINYRNTQYFAVGRDYPEYLLPEKVFPLEGITFMEYYDTWRRVAWQVIRGEIDPGEIREAMTANLNRNMEHLMKEASRKADEKPRHRITMDSEGLKDPQRQPAIERRKNHEI